MTSVKKPYGHLVESTAQLHHFAILFNLFNWFSVVQLVVQSWCSWVQSWCSWWWVKVTAPSNYHNINQWVRSRWCSGAPQNEGGASSSRFQAALLGGLNLVLFCSQIQDILLSLGQFLISHPSLTPLCASIKTEAPKPAPRPDQHPSPANSLINQHAPANHQSSAQASRPHPHRNPETPPASGGVIPHTYRTLSICPRGRSGHSVNPHPPHDSVDRTWGVQGGSPVDFAVILAHRLAFELFDSDGVRFVNKAPAHG